MKNIDIISACSDLGVIVDGANLGPKVLEKYILNKKIYELNTGKVEKEREENNKRKNLLEINKFNRELYQNVRKIIQEGKIPLTIGGDHSIAIGSALGAIQEYKKMGIIWFDSHGDFNTLDTTATGNIHGLPLAVITGFEKRELAPFHQGNFFSYDNTVIVGARDIDEWEMPNLKKAGVTIFTTEDIKIHGAEEITKKAIQIAEKDVEGLHISYDIDLIDPELAPGVSVPAKNGINLDDAYKIVDTFLEYEEKIKSIDLVEFNPKRDINGKTEKIANQILQKIMKE